MLEAGAITAVAEGDLGDLLGLMRSYCDFYGVSPTDENLIALSKELIQHPSEGMQLICREKSGNAVGFATVFWTWSTLSASRVGVMNDLFVVPEARGTGVADALIERCASECRAKGANELVWQTALDNARAQAVYDRIGAVRSNWLDYSLAVKSD